MNLRKRLSAVLLYSIEHRHSPEDNVSLVEAIRSGGIAPPGLDEMLAESIRACRESGGVPLEDIRRSLNLSANQAGLQIEQLIKSHFMRWKDTYLVVAPFPMDWGINAHRLTFKHPEGHVDWKASHYIERRIHRRPGGGSGVADPRYMNHNITTAKSRDHLPKVGSSTTKKVGSQTTKSLSIVRESVVPDPTPNHDEVADAWVPYSKTDESWVPDNTGMYRAFNKKVSKRVSSLLRKELAAVASATSADALDKVSQSTIIRDEVKTARRKTMDDDWGLEPELLEEDAPATQALAEPSCERKRATDSTQEESAPSCTDKPKATRKRDRTPAAKKGEDDPQFVKVWEALKAAHEALECFGDGGVGSRNHAWAAWNSQLTRDEMAAAAAGIERYVAFQKARGYKLQPANWWIKDRSWKRVPADFRLGQTTALVQPRPAAPPAVTRDPWRFGVELLLSKGNAAGLPGNLDLAVFASWPDESRDRFVALVREIEPSGSKRLKAISLRAYAACYPSDADAEPVRPEMLAASAKAIVGGASLQLRGPLARSRHRPMSQEEISAYCRSVGVSDTPTRFSRLR